jgi:HKD family nuclease
MSLFPNSRAVVVGVPESFDLLAELESAKTIRLATAFAHKSGWDMVARSIERSRAERYLLAGTSLFQTEPAVLREWLSLCHRANVSAALHTDKSITFHPKVLIIEGKKRFAIVGSGNLSRGGLQENIECGVFVDTTSLLKELLLWFDALFRASPRLNDSLLLNYEKDWTSLRRQVKDLRKRQKELEGQLADENAAIMKMWNKAVSAARQYMRSAEFPKAYYGRMAGGQRIKKALQYSTGFDFDKQGWEEFYSVFALGHLIPISRNSIFKKKRKLQAGLRALVQPGADVSAVLNEFLSPNGKFHISGFALNTISKILAVHRPRTWAVYNTPVSSTLKRFGYVHPRGASPAERFMAFNRMMYNFKSETGLQDAYALDAFFFHLFRQSKGIRRDPGSLAN